MAGPDPATTEWVPIWTMTPVGAPNTVALYDDVGKLSYDSLLTYDRTTDRLGVGTASPSSTFHVVAASGVTAGILNVQETNSNLRIRSHQYWDTNIGLNVINIGSTGSLGSVTKVTGVAVDDLPTVPAGGQALGFWTGMSAGTNRWGFFASGTANNYFNGNVGIKVSVPTYTLQVAGTVGIGSTTYMADSLHVAAGGIGINTAPVAGYAIYTNANWSVIGGRLGIATVPNHMLHVQGDVGIATTLLVQGQTTLNGGLVATGDAQLGRTGIAYAPDVNYWLRSGAAYIDRVTSTCFYYNNSGRWPLDITGQGHITQLGVYYGPDVAATEGVDLRCYRGKFDKIGAGRGLGVNDLYAGYAQIDALYVGGNVQPSWTLHVEGASMLRRLGVGIDPNPLPANTMQAGYIGVGYAPNGSYSIRAGATYVDSLTVPGAVSMTNTVQMTYLVGIAGAADSRWNFTNWGSSYFNGTCQHASGVGFGYGPTGSWIRAGDSHFDSLGAGYAGGSGYNFRCGSAYLDSLGVATAPYAGWNIAANNILAWSAIQSSGTLYAVGYSTLAGGAAIHQNLAAYATNYQYGGGVWADLNSSRELKTNIDDIHDALNAVLRLHGRTWDWGEDQTLLQEKLPGRRTGFIVEEIEEVFPQWIVEVDGKKGYAEKGLSAYFVEAFREVKTLITELQDYVYHLNARITVLEQYRS